MNWMEAPIVGDEEKKPLSWTDAPVVEEPPSDTPSAMSWMDAPVVEEEPTPQPMYPPNLDAPAPENKLGDRYFVSKTTGVGPLPEGMQVEQPRPSGQVKVGATPLPQAVPEPTFKRPEPTQITADMVGPTIAAPAATQVELPKPVASPQAPTILTNKEEADFQKWYAGISAQEGIDANPDNPQHFYDYRGAWKAGITPDKTGHWDSRFKLEGHPNLIIDGVDTRTGKPVQIGTVEEPSTTATQIPVFQEPVAPALPAAAPARALQEEPLPATVPQPESPDALMEEFRAQPDITAKAAWYNALPQQDKEIFESEAKVKRSFIDELIPERSLIDLARMSNDPTINPQTRKAITEGKTEYLIGRNLMPDEVDKINNELIPLVKQEQPILGFLSRLGGQVLNIGAQIEKLKGPLEYKPATKLAEKTAKKLYDVSKVLEPQELQKYDIENRVARLKEYDSESARAFEQGDLGFIIDQRMGNATLSNDKEAYDKWSKIKEQYLSTVQDYTPEKRPMLRNIWISTMEMLAPMAKTGVKMAIPVVGQAWSLYEWTQQGVGDTTDRLIKAGVDFDTARKIAPVTGLVYAAIEQAQVQQIANIGFKITEEMAKEAISKALLKLGQEKLKDYVGEVSEEVLQELVQQVGTELGKYSKGKEDRKIGDVLWASATELAKTAKEAAGPMGLLSAFGLGGGLAGTAVQRVGVKAAKKDEEKNGAAAVAEAARQIYQPTPAQRAAGEVPETKFQVVDKATGRVIGNLGDVTQAQIDAAMAEKKKPAKAVPVKTNMPQTIPEGAAVEQKTLEDFGLTPEQFLAKPVAERDHIFSQLSQAEQDVLVRAEPPVTSEVKDEKEGRQGETLLKQQAAAPVTQGAAVSVPEKKVAKGVDKDVAIVYTKSTGEVVGPKEMDALTGLPNNSVTKTEIANTAEDDWVVSFDADNFKAVNDTAGHAEGDRVLRQIGEIARKHFPDKFVGREGGEEFAIRWGKEFTENDANRIKAFHDDISKTIRVDGDPVTLSVGVARGTETDGQGNKSVRSDRASYKAKEKGRNQIAFRDENNEYFFVAGAEKGEKKYVAKLDEKQLEDILNRMGQRGEIDPDAARRAIEKSRQGKARTPTSGRGIPAGEGARSEVAAPPNAPPANTTLLKDAEALGIPNAVSETGGLGKGFKSYKELRDAVKTAKAAQAPAAAQETAQPPTTPQAPAAGEAQNVAFARGIPEAVANKLVKEPPKVKVNGYQAPNGNQLVGFEWRRMTGERVSDWERSEKSAISGRDIVRVYWVKDAKTGEVLPHGIQSAKKALQITSNRIFRRAVEHLRVEQGRYKPTEETADKGQAGQALDKMLSPEQWEPTKTEGKRARARWKNASAEDKESKLADYTRYMVDNEPEAAGIRFATQKPAEAEGVQNEQRRREEEGTAGGERDLREDVSERDREADRQGVQQGRGGERDTGVARLLVAGVEVTPIATFETDYGTVYEISDRETFNKASVQLAAYPEYNGDTVPVISSEEGDRLQKEAVAAVSQGKPFKKALTAGDMQRRADEQRVAFARTAPEAVLEQPETETDAKIKKEYEATEKKYGGKKAYDAAKESGKTELTYRQWIQVRTPAFIKWFGDWTKHAGKEVGSLWSDDTVSKVINTKTGEPLVVYHGTDKSGFVEFRPEKGQTSYRPASVFFTSEPRVARTYSGTREVAVPMEPNEYGDYEEASGIYDVFLNIKNPHEENFEGANWDGTRYDQWKVVTGEEDEQVYSDDGKGVWNHEEEAELVAEKNKGSRVVKAEDHYTSTNGVAKEAARYDNDGAIIYEVIDDGGKGTTGDTSTLFIAFDSNQIKSATYNVGTFDKKSPDIRFARQKPQAAATGFSRPTAEEIKQYSVDPEDVPVGKWAGRTLFHGTSKPGAQSIVDEGIDISKSTGGYFGRGFYMASDVQHAQSSYADMNETDEPGDVIAVRVKPTARILDLREPRDWATYIATGLDKQIWRDNFPQLMIEKGIDGIHDRAFGGVVIYNQDVLEPIGKRTDIRFARSAPAVSERREAPAFYSPTIRTIETDVKQEKGVAPQIRSMLKSGKFKKSETDWVGLEKFLADNPQATKTDVLDYLREKQVRVEVVEKGVPAHDIDWEIDNKGNLSGEDDSGASWEIIKNEGTYDVYRNGSLYIYTDRPTTIDEAKKIVAEDKDAAKTRFTQYNPFKTSGMISDYIIETHGNEYVVRDRDGEAIETTTSRTEAERVAREGEREVPSGGNLGTNPREINLVMPEPEYTPVLELDDIVLTEYKKADKNTKALLDEISNIKGGAQDFASGIRRNLLSTDDFTGKEAPFIKDWKDGHAKIKQLPPTYRVPSAHQYGDRADVNRIAHLRTWDVDYKGEKALAVAEAQSDWTSEARKKGVAVKITKEFAKGQGFTVDKAKATSGEEAYFIDNPTDEYFYRKGFPNTGFNTEAEAWDSVVKKLKETSSAVPPMPFFKNWDELATKKAILLAANEGYDRIVFANGAQTAALYDLSKSISEVAYSGTNLKAWDLDGKEVISTTGITPEQLPDYIGKDAAGKLLAQKPEGTLRRLSGVELKVGGEWATNLYDKRVPSILRDLIRKNKWNTALEEIDIGAENGPNISMKITPEMRDSITSDGGLPMFRREQQPVPKDSPTLYRPELEPSKPDVVQMVRYFSAQAMEALHPDLQKDIDGIEVADTFEFGGKKYDLSVGDPTKYEKEDTAMADYERGIPLITLKSKRADPYDTKNRIPIRTRQDLRAAMAENGVWVVNQVQGATVPMPNGKTRFYFNKNTSPDVIARRVYHELMGHFGAGRVLGTNNKIYTRLKKLSQLDKGSDTWKMIESEYSDLVKRGDEDGLFGEWVAFQMEKWTAEQKPGLAQQVWNLVKDFLISIGVAEGDVNDAMRTLVREMGKRHAGRTSTSVAYAQEIGKYDQAALTRITARIFNLPMLKGRKTYNEQMITGALKQQGVRKAEQEIVTKVLNNFEDKKNIPADVFRAQVEAALLPLTQIQSAQWSDYGHANIGLKADTAISVVYNSPLEHGITGHWSAEFGKAFKTKTDYEMQKVPNTEVWIAIDKNRPAGLPPEQLQNYVATAGSQAKVLDWITQFKERKTEAPNEGLFGHSRRADLGTQRLIVEIQADALQHGVEDKMYKVASEDWLTDFIDWIQKENIVVWSAWGSDKWNAVLLQFAETDKGSRGKGKIEKGEWVPNKLWKNSLKNATRVIEEEKSATIGFKQDAQNELEYAKKVADLAKNGEQWTVVYREDLERKWTLKDRDTDTHSKSYPTEEEARRLAAEQNAHVLSVENATIEDRNLKLVRYDAEIVVLDQKLEIINKLSNYLNKIEPPKLTDEERWFLSFKGTWHERLIREEIKAAAIDGKEEILFPFPKTVALIEGFIPSHRATQRNVIEANEDGDDDPRERSVGDEIQIGGRDVTVLEVQDDGILVAPSRRVSTYRIRELINEKVSDDLYQVKSEFDSVLRDYLEEIIPDGSDRALSDGISGYEAKKWLEENEGEHKGDYPYEVEMAFKEIVEQAGEEANVEPAYQVDSSVIATNKNEWREFLMGNSDMKNGPFGSQHKEYLTALDYDVDAYGTMGGRGTITTDVSRHIQQRIKDAIEYVDYFYGKEAEPTYYGWSDVRNIIEQSIEENYDNYDWSDYFGGDYTYFSDADDADGYIYTTNQEPDLVPYPQEETREPEIAATPDVPQLPAPEEVLTEDEGFDISTLNHSHQTIVKRYKEEVADFLKKTRGSNLVIVKDKNGHRWWSTKITQEDLLEPVVAFARQGAQPQENIYRQQNREENIRRLSSHLDAFKNKKISQGKVIVFSDNTPMVLRDILRNNYPIIASQQTVGKIIGTKEGDHNISLDIVRSIVDKIADPVMIFNSKTDGIVVATDQKDKNGKKIVVVFKKDSSNRLNHIASIYGREKDSWFVEQVAAGRLLYADKDRASQIYGIRQTQLSKGIKMKGSTDNIPQNEGDFNKNVDVRFARVKPKPDKAADINALLAAAPDAVPPENKARAAEGYPQPANKNLIALHNLSAENIEFSHALGGIPAPSLAIIKKGMPFSGFGEITLIAPIDMVNPEYVKVFDADVYSGRSPQVLYRVGEQGGLFRKRLRDARRRLEGTTGEGNIEQAIDGYKKGKKDEFISSANHDTAVMAMFVEEFDGEEIDPPMERRSLSRYGSLVETKAMREFFESKPEDYRIDTSNYTDKDFVAALKAAIEEHAASLPKGDAINEIIKEGLLEDLFDKETGEPYYGPVGYFDNDYYIIKTNQQEVDRSALRDMVDAQVQQIGQEKFEEWVKNKANSIFGSPYIERGRQKLTLTLDNMVDAIIGRGVRGQEKGWTFSVGQARSAGARQLKNVEQMQNKQRTIVTREEMDTFKKGLDEKFFAISNAIETTHINYNPNTRALERLDDLAKSIADYYKGAKGVSGMRRALARNGYQDVDDMWIEDAVAFADELRNAPTEYFEAKIERGVSLKEFRGAVIPKKTSKNVRAILEANGIPYVEYENNEDRAAVVQQFGETANVVFARQKPGTLKGAIEAKAGVRKPYDFVTAKYSAEEMQRKINQLRGKMLWKAMKNKQLMEARGQLDLMHDAYTQQMVEIERLQDKAKIAEMRDIMLGELRRMITEYARMINYSGSITGTAVKNIRSPMAISAFIERMDRHVEESTSRRLVKKILSVLKGYKKRIKRWESGNKAPIPAENIRALKEFFALYTDERPRLNIDSINDRVDRMAMGQKGVTPLTPDEQRLKNIYDKMYTANEDDGSAELSEEEKVFFFNVQRPPLQLMSSDELGKVLEDLKSVYKDGKTIQQKIVEREKLHADERARAAAAQILRSMKRQPEAEGTPAARAIEGTEERRKRKKLSETLVEWGNIFTWGVIRPELITEYYTDSYPMFGMKEGAVTRFIWNPLWKSGQNEVRELHRSMEWIKDNFKDMPVQDMDKPFMKVTAVGERDGEGNVTRRDEYVVTLNQAMFVYANSQNENNKRHLDGTGFDLLSVVEVGRALPQEYKDAVDRLIDYYDNSVYPRMNDVFKKVYNIDMPKEIRYFPIMRLDRKSAENSLMIDLMQRYSSAQPAVVQKGMTKKRVKSAVAFRDLDFFGTVFFHAKQAEHYIAYEESINSVRRFMRNPVVEKAMKDKNEEAYATLNRWLKDVAANKIPNTNTRLLDRWADYARKNYAVFALGLNPRVWMKQFSSLPISFAFTNPLSVMNNVAQITCQKIQHPTKLPELVRFAQELSPMMAERTKNNERDIEELVKNKDFEKFWGVGAKVEKLQELAMKFIQDFDMLVAASMWKARFDEVLTKSGSQEAAVKAADTLVRRTQSIGGIMNLPESFRQKGLRAAYTMFLNQVNQQANLLYMISKASGVKGIPRDKKLKVSLAALSAMMAGSVLIYLIDNAFSLKRVKDDPEGLAKEIIMGAGIGSFVITNVVVDRGLIELGNAVKRSTGRKPMPVWDLNFDPTVFESFRTVADIATQSTKIPEDLKYKDYDAFRKHGLKATQLAAEAATAVSGLPFSFPLRSAKGVTRIKDEGLAALLYPKSRLTDLSIEAAMADRLLKSSTWQKRYEFVKWFDKLSPEKQKKFIEYTIKEQEVLPDIVIDAVEKIHDRLFNQGDMFEKSMLRLEKDFDDGELKEDEFKEKRERIQREGKRYADLMQELSPKQKK